MKRKRQYRPASFDIPAETQLKEMQRRQHAECAVKVISESLMLLFAYEPQAFSTEIKKLVIKQAAEKCPASLEAWLEHWPGNKKEVAG